MIRPLLLTAATLLALAAAGCGADDTGGDDPLAALETAARKTGDAESFRQRFAMRSDLGGYQLSIKGEGTFSSDNTRARMKATRDFNGEKLTFESIANDGVMYIKSDQIPMPKGKEWLKTKDPAEGMVSPSEFVRYLLHSGDVENVGTEEIRGEQTTHFRSPLDVDALAKESGPALIQRLRKTPLIKDMTLVVDIWVTPDGRPSRMVLEMTDHVREDAGSMVITAETLEFDVEVDAEAPPPAKVATG
jgi:hypothetical protein